MIRAARTEPFTLVSSVECQTEVESEIVDVDFVNIRVNSYSAFFHVCFKCGFDCRALKIWVDISSCGTEERWSEAIRWVLRFLLCSVW